nr:hypothetical protein [Pedobacter sp. ASV19]
MKKVFKSGLLAAVALAGLCSAFAFKSADGIKRSATTLAYTYTLSTSTGARIAGNWSPITSGSGPSCGLVGETPCKVVFDSGTYTDIEAYLTAQAFSSDDDVAFGPGVSRKQ